MLLLEMLCDLKQLDPIKERRPWNLNRGNHDSSWTLIFLQWQRQNFGMTSVASVTRSYGPRLFSQKKTIAHVNHCTSLTSQLSNRRTATFAAWWERSRATSCKARPIGRWLEVLVMQATRRCPTTFLAPAGKGPFPPSVPKQHNGASSKGIFVSLCWGLSKISLFLVCLHFLFFLGDSTWLPGRMVASSSGCAWTSWANFARRTRGWTLTQCV